VGFLPTCRVLYGSLKVRSFDWVDKQQRQAALVADQEVSAGDGPSVLGPETGGNMHAFTAITDTAVLDVLCPPYDVHGGEC